MYCIHRKLSLVPEPSLFTKPAAPPHDVIFGSASANSETTDARDARAASSPNAKEWGFKKTEPTHTKHAFTRHQNPPRAPPRRAARCATPYLSTGRTRPHRWQNICHVHRCFGLLRRSLPQCFANEARGRKTFLCHTRHDHGKTQPPVKHHHKGPQQHNHCGTKVRHASCMTTRTFAADTDPSTMLLELKMLLSAAYTSDHLTPSVLTPTVKDFAGNSHWIPTALNFFWPPRSAVTVTGPAGSNALAWKQTLTKTQTHTNAEATLLTQNVLELPSTAMLAPCAAASAVLLAVMAPRAATSSTPAAGPFWLKH